MFVIALSVFHCIHLGEYLWLELGYLLVSTIYSSLYRYERKCISKEGLSLLSQGWKRMYSCYEKNISISKGLQFRKMCAYRLNLFIYINVTHG